MALLGLDRLVKKDLFTAELWNSLVDILEAKFSSGVSSGDISWPMLTQGNIDFQQTYGIVGLREFWNVVLCDGGAGNGYDTLDAAIAAVAGTGGGAIFIPPYTTVSTNNSSITASNVTIFGSGPTSVIKITAAATGPMITTATSGLSDITLANLALDGTGGGAGCVGVSAKRVARFRMLNVYMTAFTGDFIVLTNGGVAGQSCTDAVLHNVHCSGGSDSHIFADDISGLIINEFVSKSATGDVISMVPGSSSHLLQDIVIANSRLQTGGAKGIRIIGSGAAGIDAHSRIKIDNCQAISMTGLPFELGNTATLLKDVTVQNCFAPASTSDGLRIATNRGVVSGCHFPAATTDGIDATNSVDLLIDSNSCQDATVNGINATSTTDCTLIANNVRDAGTTGILRTTATGLRSHNNPGDIGTTAAAEVFDLTGYTRTAGSGAGDIGWLYTIQANSIRDGDIIDVFARITQGGGGTGVIELRIGGVASGAVNTTTLGGAHVHWRIYAKQGSASRVLTTAIGATSGVSSLASATPTVDWTASVALTIQVTTISVQDIVLSTVDTIFTGGR